MIIKIMKNFGTFQYEYFIETKLTDNEIKDILSEHINQTPYGTSSEKDTEQFIAKLGKKVSFKQYMINYTLPHNPIEECIVEY